jgi:hypothetical protein
MWCEPLVRLGRECVDVISPFAQARITAPEL